MINLDFISPKDAPRLKNAAEKPFLAQKNLKVLEFENAVIAPDWNGGVWDNQNQHLPQTWLYWQSDTPPQNPPESLHWWRDVRQKTPPKIAEKSEESVVFIGLFPGTWGHEITDNLKHLWFYFDEKYAHLKSLPLSFAMLYPANRASDNFFIFLETLGIAKSQIRQITKPTQFARVFVPDECFFYDPEIGACRYTAEYARFFDLLFQKNLPARSPLNPPAEKIYLSRTAFASIKDFNEIEVENFFKNQGFTIIHPEQFSFLEQLAIYQNAKIFATTDGSIAHNLLFCKAGTTALICRKSRQFTIHQLTINAFKNARAVYIDCAFSPFADFQKEWWGDWSAFFLYETNDLRRYFSLPPKKNRPPFLPFLKYCAAGFLKLFSLALHKIDRNFLFWSRPLRDKLQLGRRIKNIQKILKIHGKRKFF